MASRRMKTSEAKEKPTVVRVEDYSGEWIAWDRQQTKIVAHGLDFAEVQAAAKKAGETEPVLQKVPIAGTVFIGAAV